MIPFFLDPFFFLNYLYTYNHQVGCQSMTCVGSSNLFVKLIKMSQSYKLKVYTSVYN